jgi:hypothetical protein
MMKYNYGQVTKYNMEEGDEKGPTKLSQITLGNPLIVMD